MPYIIRVQGESPYVVATHSDACREAYGAFMALRPEGPAYDEGAWPELCVLAEYHPELLPDGGLATARECD